MSKSEEFYERGDVLSVVLPTEKTASAEVKKLRDILISHSIKKVIILARNNDHTYYAVSCHDTAKDGDIRISIGNKKAYASVLPLLVIEDIALKPCPNSELANKHKILLQIEYQQQSYSKKKKSTKGNRKIIEIDGFNQSQLLQNIKKSSDTVVCPRCQKRISTSNRNVFIEGLGFQILRVGLCDRCFAYYSHDKRLLTRKGTLNGKNVSWSNLRYKNVNGNLVLQHTLPPLQEQNQLHDVHRTIQPTNSAETRASFRKFETLLCQVPIVVSRNMNCPICRKVTSDTARIQYLQYDRNGDSEKRYGCSRICSACDIVFLDEGQTSEIKQRAGQKQVSFVEIDGITSRDAFINLIAHKPDISPSITPRVNLPFDFDVHEIPNLSHEYDSILVYARKCECYQCRKHYGFDTTKNRTAVINTIFGEIIKVNVMFCCGCGTYFMSIVSFKEYKKRYGGLLLEYSYTEDCMQKKHSDFNMASDSVLSRCGYTADGSISKEHRQAILAFIMDSGRATKSRLITLLQAFLELGEKRKNCPDACDRWREDIFYVNEYEIDLQKKVYGLAFKQAK